MNGDPLIVRCALKDNWPYRIFRRNKEIRVTFARGMRLMSVINSLLHSTDHQFVRDLLLRAGLIVVAGVEIPGLLPGMAERPV